MYAHCIVLVGMNEIIQKELSYILHSLYHNHNVNKMYPHHFFICIVFYT